jgi:PAS domain S-box-containing protein
MRIRTRLRIGILLSMVLAFVVIISSVLLLRNIWDDLDRSRRGNDIIRMASQLAILIDKYKYEPSARLIQQIEGAGTELRTTLEKLSAAGEESVTLGQMHKSSQKIDALLEILTANERPPEAMYAERREVITSNLQIMTRFLVDEASQFVEISHDRISRVSAIGFSAGASLFAFLFLAHTAIVSLVSKRLRFGLERLTQGATQIGGGNLLHRISLQGRDEFNDLAETFNGMANSLEASRTLVDETQEKLSAERERLHTILRQLPSGVMIAEAASGRIIYANAHAERLFGPEYPLEGAEKYLERWQPHHEDGSLYDLEEIPMVRAIKGETTSDQVMRYQRPDGSWMITEVSGAPIVDSRGEVLEGVITISDITDRKLIEQELVKSEQMFRSLFESSPIGIFVTSSNGSIIDANPAAMEIFGWSKEDIFVLGRSGLLDQNDPQLVAGLGTGRIQAQELTAIRKSGERFPVEVDSVVLPTDPNRSFVMLRDISDRKRAEDELRTLAAELENRVRERTLELEHANRAKDEFLANMSHEIRTPMSGVFGITDILLQQNLPTIVSKDLELIRASSSTVLTLLNDLLDLSRIEQGKLKLEISPFDIRSIVNALVRPYEIQAAEKGIFFDVSVDQDVPEFFNCDSDRIGQVLKNLLMNALKFTEAGSITLRVHLDKETAHLARLRFSVTDTGIGIPEEKQTQLFQAFTQLDPSYSKKFAGAGLGLAISKKLVELMGGEFAVESVPGQGSTFSFTVSFEKAEYDGLSEQRQKATLSDLPPLSILLAEDNSVNRLFLRRALNNAGHKVVEAGNGLEVLEKITGDSIELILMDIQMPEMDGVEAARRIRSGGYGKPDIPIIALTAYAMKGDREKFMAGGMDGYVTKPVDFGELARTIAEVIGIPIDEFNTSG